MPFLESKFEKRATFFMFLFFVFFCMCVLLYSKAAVQDVLHAGKVCLLDIDMQVNEAPKIVLY